MRTKIFIILFLFFSAVIISLTHEQVRLYISAQQQQGILNFSSSEDSVESTELIYTASAEDLTQQVDWVYDNMGRCWNAWSSYSCGLQQHEGGVTVPSMRDLDHDGIEDITCSQGGTDQGTTITNTSDKTITISCERYTCMSCATGNGTFAQCDGNTDPNAKRIVETVELTPGCVATCTMTGVYGTCLDDKTPPPPQITDVPTNTPVPANTTVPTSAPTKPAEPSPTVTTTQTTPTTVPQTSATPIPTNTGVPPTTPPQATQPPQPTAVPAGSELPVSIDYSSFREEYNEFPPTYVYAMMNRSYNALNTTRGINGLKQIQGNVVKMIMISEYNALEQILQNHAQELKDAGVTWVGYNAERDGRTPQNELTDIFSSDPSTNVINKMGRLVEQHGFKLMLGPTTPMWEEYFRRSDRNEVAEAMIGDNCYLDGIAFQEQKQISLTNKEQRANIIAERTSFFKNHAQNCPHFEASVQLMSSWCEQNASWDECKGYYDLLKGLEGNERINSLAIWASGAERNQLQQFIEFLRN